MPAPTIRVERDEQRQRADEVRRDAAQQGLALAQRLAHERQLAVFEVAQAAVNQAR
jgi:hypothetical protein